VAYYPGISMQRLSKTIEIILDKLPSGPVLNTNLPVTSAKCGMD
jgi:hypothetical protein